MTTLTATKLIVTASPLYDGSDTQPQPYNFDAFEFSNGAIMVPGETTNDWYFNDRSNIEACGSDEVVSITETDEAQEFVVEELLESVRGSISEFETSDGTETVLELCLGS